MKLGELNAAIRGHKGAIILSGRFHPEGQEDIELIDLEITKQSVLNAIKTAFPDFKRGDETYLKIKPNGHIDTEGNEDGSDQPEASGEMSRISEPA